MKNRFAIAFAFIPLSVAVAQSAIVASPCAANAQTKTANGGAALSAQGMWAFRTLEHVPYFAVGGVGIAGRTSDGELALRVLLQEPKGSVVLRGLFKTATPAGKLYALLGFKETGVAHEVAEVADSIQARKGLVEVRRGCMGSHEPLSTLAAKIQNRVIVLPKPSRYTFPPAWKIENGRITLPPGAR